MLKVHSSKLTESQRTSPGPYPERAYTNPDTGQWTVKSPKGQRRDKRKWEHRNEQSKQEVRDVMASPEEIMNAQIGEVVNINGLNRIRVDPQGPYPQEHFYFPGGKELDITDGQEGRITGEANINFLDQNHPSGALSRYTPNLDTLPKSMSAPPPPPPPSVGQPTGPRTPEEYQRMQQLRQQRFQQQRQQPVTPPPAAGGGLL